MTGTRTAIALTAAAAAIVLTVSLGNWQLRRADEKLALQAQWDRAWQSAPLAVAGADIAVVARQLPRRVQVRGRYLFEHEVWLDNRQMDGQTGLMLIAPLRWPVVVVVLIALLAATYFETDFLDQLGVNPGVIPLTGMIAILLVGYFIYKKKSGWAFALTSVTIAFTLVTMFLIMYPRVMISRLNPAWSLTIYNASSSRYTLQVMTIVALIFVPIVLAYQGWTYWIFRKRVSADPKTLTY